MATFFPKILCDCGHTVSVKPGHGSSVICDQCGAGHSPSMARYGEEGPPGEYQIPPPQPGMWNRFACPGCKAPVEVSPQFAATQIRCRACGAMLKLG